VGINPGSYLWGPSFEHFFMIIQAAIAGIGVALLPSFLIEEELKKGDLVAPFTDSVAGPGAYYLITSAAKAQLPRVKLFREWLLETIG
jgi:DNA-binding transcriptional LysR family regulator